MRPSRYWTIALAPALVALLLLGPEAAVAQNTDDAPLVTRGEYLARAADCMPCHTSDKSKPFAGGFGLPTPFGTLFSANITSDPETGIGKWTYEDFKRALHDGIRADGSYLYPAMPFDAYTKIEEEDLKALWAYVRRIPPMSERNRDNQLSFPFNIRMLMIAWRELFFVPGFFEPTQGKSAEWNRGAYLVEALAHCSDCHSPRNIMGAIKGKMQFTGADVDGFYAPDIASSALAKTWTKSALLQFLKTGAAPQKTVVFGPMADVVHDSLAYLTDPDLNAMATYLLDSPPPPDVPAPQKLSPLPPDVYREATKLYIDNCAGCHQDHGTGIAGAVPPLAGNPAVTAAEPYNVITVVLEGLPPGGSYGAMPSFAGRLSNRQVADLANYVRTSWGNRAAPNVSAEMIGGWRATADVPDYGTEAATAFTCPQVGGAPGAPGPNAKAVAELTLMLQGGDRDVLELIGVYQRAAPTASPAEVVDALIAAYCPVVASGDAPPYHKYAELRRFTRQVAAGVSPQAAAVPLPPVDTVWATPLGRSLVGREPLNLSGPLNCPADDGKHVPSNLVAEATTLLGKPKLPAGGELAMQLATSLSTQSPKATPFNVANALIVAYCSIVKADTSAEEALQKTWLQAFGDQVIQTLQLRTMARNQ